MVKRRAEGKGGKRSKVLKKKRGGEISREEKEDKRQAREGKSPCNFYNPPGIYTFTRQIMEMKNKMEKFPSQTRHRIFLIFFFLSVALLNFFPLT